MIRYAIGSLMLFIAGFLIFHGKEAAHSGSWDYVVTHDDEYIYWAIAQGSTASPASDANPFYYEERTRNNPVPSYLAVTAAGRLAAALDIQVLALLPPWKILMPFLSWLVFFLCLVRLWGYNPAISAAVSMLVLLSTLFLHGAAQFTLFRFPRPGDSLWLAILWLSLLVHADRMSPRRYQAVMLAIAFATMAITPYYTILQVWTGALQCAWDWRVRRDWPQARSHLMVMLVLFFCACGYLLFILLHMDESHWVGLVLDVGQAGSRQPHFFSLLLYALICSMVFAAWRACGSLSRLDRLVLFVLALEPLTANVQLVLGQDHQIGLHRYYFLVLEITCLVGWAVEKLQFLVRQAAFRRADIYLAAALGLIAAYVLLSPQLNYFRDLPSDVPTFHSFDNSLQLLGLLPLLLLCPWIVLRFASISRFLRRPLVAVLAIAAIAFCGFYFRSSQLRDFNREIPFTGAYAWLAEHGSKDAVLLTGPPQRSVIDYALFYAGVKSYANPSGQRLSLDAVDMEYRRYVYSSLLHGGLGVVLPEYSSIRQKMKHLKLDYILLEWPSPHEKHVTSQLLGYIREVYRDERCILWELVVP